MILPLCLLLFVLSACQKGVYDDDFSEEIGNTDQAPAGGADGEVFLTLYRISGDNIDKIKDYEVANRYQDAQQDYALHLDMWNYFTRLIPTDYRLNITEFIVFDGRGDLAGFVEPIQDDLSTWRMGLAIDAAGNLANIDLQEEFASVAIHEYGHVLTLNKEQVDAGGSEGSCPQFHTGEGCAHADAYINELFDIGWSDIYDEFLGTNENKIYTRFYPKYQDRFVSEYAATNPGEDIAEVFTHFVVENSQRSGNSIAAQKINALYQYPELTSLRKHIRQNPAVRTINMAQRKRKSCRHTKGHRINIQ